MKNKWVCIKNSFAAWNIRFEPATDTASIERLLQYSADLLAIAKEEKVFWIKQSRLGMLGAPNLPYIEQLRWVFEQKKILPFFGYLNGALNQSGFVAETPARIAYYNKSGEITEGEVADLGKLLLELENNVDERLFARHLSPIEIIGVKNLSLSSLPSITPDFFITTHSDIWFAKIVGYQMENKAELLDNRELSSIHTPRLNQFLKAARKLTISYGGTWAVMKPELYPAYWNMVLEDSIQLES